MNRLAIRKIFGSIDACMAMPNDSVTLDQGELQDLSKKLSNMRHDINNHLSLIIAAAELIKNKPQSSERMIATLAEQPVRIAEAIKKFSAEFDKALRISRS